ncbi:MAG: hypothetical protein ACI865_002531 [Flavobacteriaceae bacterium]|jgi:hypothetical protein
MMTIQDLFKSRFFLPNLILSLFIGISYFIALGDFDLVRPVHNPFMGYALGIVAIVVMPFTIIKARDISFKYNEGLSKGETFIAVMIYFNALFVTALIFYEALGMISDGRFSDIEMGVGFGLAGISVIVLLFEGFALIGKPKKAPNRKLVLVSNIMVPIYTGIAIVVLWNGAFDMNFEDAPITGRKIFQATLFAFVLILPFQRLLWYESFVSSQGKRENLKAMISILMSIATAVFGVL